MLESWLAWLAASWLAVQYSYIQQTYLRMVIVVFDQFLTGLEVAGCRMAGWVGLHVPKAWAAAGCRFACWT